MITRMFDDLDVDNDGKLVRRIMQKEGGVREWEGLFVCTSERDVYVRDGWLKCCVYVSHCHVYLLWI